MVERWLDITDIPDAGREFTFEEQGFWTEGWREYHMDYSPAKPFAARFKVIPQGRGVMVQGKLEGSLTTPCDRCAKPIEVAVSENFDLLEEERLPGEDSLEPTLLRRRGKVLELDAGGMLWEEFVLALPVKPLCAESCKGLCPHCGKDMNLGSCDCEGAGVDPRLAALRGLTIVKKD